MKNKFLSIVLALTLVLAYAVPVAANTDETLPAAEQKIKVQGEQSADPGVQAAYDAYQAMTAGLEADDYNVISENYNKYMDLIDNFSDEQLDEWNNIVSKEIGSETAIGNLYDASMIVYVVELRDEFELNPCISTANDFISAYDDCIEAEIEITKVVPGIEDSYSNAKDNYMPSQDVLKVYDAYTGIKTALDSGLYDEDFIAAYKDFEDVLEIINEMSDDDMNAFAELIGAEDAEEAYVTLLIDWIDMNIIDMIGTAENEYLENPNKETAQNYVDVYESVFFDDTETLSEEEIALYATFFDGTSYEDAKAFLAEGEDKTPVDTSKEKNKPVDENSPETGDDFNAAPYTVMMLIAAAAGAMALKRKRI